MEPRQTTAAKAFACVRRSNSVGGSATLLLVFALLFIVMSPSSLAQMGSTAPPPPHSKGSTPVPPAEAEANADAGEEKCVAAQTNANPKKTKRLPSSKKSKLLPDSLQVGDYLPFVSIETRSGGSRNVHSFCNDKPFFLLTVDSMDSILGAVRETLISLAPKFNVIVVSEEHFSEEKCNKLLYTTDSQLNRILEVRSQVKVYIASPDRRMVQILSEEEFLLTPVSEFDPAQYLAKGASKPYLVVEDALDLALLERVKAFYAKKKGEGSVISANGHSTKDRLHVHPDQALAEELDDKLSRSVLPEVRKLFYFDVQYREDYKLCSYDADTAGRFHAHRDTPAPYQHRKYAMSLILNDDYEGGELYLPEYGLKIKPKPNTAVVFPGISTHQVLEVTKGSRMAIITFFVSPTNAKQQYKMKSHFFDDREIVDSEIYPSPN